MKCPKIILDKLFNTKYRQFTEKCLSKNVSLISIPQNCQDEKATLSFRSSPPEVFFKKGGCSSVNLLRIFRTPFRKNASEWLLLELQINSDKQCPSGYLQKQPSKGVLRKR